MERRKLSDVEIAERLTANQGWSVEEGKVTKTFEFKSYASGVVFAAAVGNEADKMDHHPDLTIGYQKVRVAVNTHDVDGISPLDFELARRVDLLFG